ncbi:lantibiotic dehydratase [[Actinomadura] parvosata]|uniref:lantibiotic dehydratase n=1 Tax=[Actinomadura] parvosata TaxID=1955412 RepID=UPI00406C1CC6
MGELTQGRYGRLTRPVRAALAAAAAPIRFDQLAAELTARFPATPEEKILALLHTLVDQRILITNLRAPMTAADPLDHLIGVLHEAGGRRPGRRRPAAAPPRTRPRPAGAAQHRRPRAGRCAARRRSGADGRARTGRRPGC